MIFSRLEVLNYFSICNMAARVPLTHNRKVARGIIKPLTFVLTNPEGLTKSLLQSLVGGVLVKEIRYRKTVTYGFQISGPESLLRKWVERLQKDRTIYIDQYWSVCGHTVPIWLQTLPHGCSLITPLTIILGEYKFGGNIIFC